MPLVKISRVMRIVEMALFGFGKTNRDSNGQFMDSQTDDRAYLDSSSSFKIRDIPIVPLCRIGDKTFESMKNMIA